MNLIFDFDGTICDSLAVNPFLASKYLYKAGRHPVSPDQIRRVSVKQLIADYEIPLLKIPQLLIAGRRELATYLPHPPSQFSEIYFAILLLPCTLVCQLP